MRSASAIANLIALAQSRGELKTFGPIWLYIILGCPFSAPSSANRSALLNSGHIGWRVAFWTMVNKLAERGKLMKILAIAPLLLIAACSKSPEAAAVENNADLLADNMEAQADAMDVAESSGPTDNWATDESVDAINDNRVITGKTQVNGETNDIQIDLSCLPDVSQLIYKISSFDKDSDGARIRPSFTSFGMMNGLIFRADAKPAQQASTLNPQYNNQTTITGDSAFQAASAKTLTLRIQYDNANETYFLNQDSDNFRRTIKPCFISRRAALDAQQAREAMANPTPEPTSTPTPIDTPTDTATPHDQPNKYRTAPLIEPSTAQPTGT